MVMVSQNLLDLGIDFGTTEKNGRHKFDRYDSPHWYLSSLIQYVSVSGVIGEPCAGGGNLSNLFPYINGVNKIWTNDIDLSVNADSHSDATNPKSWEQFPGTDWIVTNPPFNVAFPILENAYRHARVGVVMFLRLSFQEPTEERGQWLFDHPRHIDLIYPRFKFRKGKDGKNWQTDSMPIVAMVWRKDTDKQFSPVSIPPTKIVGYHDNPTNAPSFDEQVRIIKAVQI